MVKLPGAGLQWFGTTGWKATVQASAGLQCEVHVMSVMSRRSEDTGDGPSFGFGEQVVNHRTIHKFLYFA